jgi:hypothetical protein
MYIGLQEKYPLLSSDFMKLEFFQQILAKYSHIKFNENPSSGSRDVPSGERDRWTDMTKLIAAIRNFANAPNNIHR